MSIIETMGRKSRQKRQKQKQVQKPMTEETRTKQEPFLVRFIQWSLFGALLTPLIISSKFYFPFVGPKSLFFMGFSQVIFFAWLILILNHREYRPTLNRILILLGVFVGVVAVSSVLGVDFSRSFWSKFERMTGLLMWLHIFGLFLAISSTFRSLKQWRKIFYVSLGIASLVAVMALLEELGVEAVNFSGKKGATLGNTSFLGTYLLFNVFLVAWLGLRGERDTERMAKLIRQGLLGIGGVVMFAAMYISGARAATAATIGGLGLLGLLWLSFEARNKTVNRGGRVLLAISVLGVLTAIVLLFVPGSFVQQKFIDMTTYARYANWDMAQKAFLERPMLGWGPENYILVFGKHFNPCLFTQRCGGEIWFDRSHNIIFDTLVTNGIIGLVAYLGLFAGVFYVLYKRYRSDKGRGVGFWSFGVITAMLCAYFIQNLTVFDMVTSLMMFVLVLGFVAGVCQRQRQKQKSPNFIAFKPWAAAGLAITFSITFFIFVWQPLRTDAFIINSLRTPDPQQRIELYKKTLATSPMGKYQIREFFGGYSQDIIQKVIREQPQELDLGVIQQELDFVTQELEKTIQAVPWDLKTVLRLANLYNLYVRIDGSKIQQAEKYGQQAIELSPTNQQGYWALAQTRAYEQRFDEALELAQRGVYLEPNWFQSHMIAFQVAQIAGKRGQAQAIKDLALKLHPDWEGMFK